MCCDVLKSQADTNFVHSCLAVDYDYNFQYGTGDM